MNSQQGLSLGGICHSPLEQLNSNPSDPPLNFRDYMIAKQDKLKHQFSSDAAQIAFKRSAFFEGIHVYVNGYTEPDSLTIKNMLASHGGIWEQYNGSHVTHIVASQMPHSKIQKNLNAANPKTIVKPDWVVACVEAGRKLPEHDFLLIASSSIVRVPHVFQSGHVHLSGGNAAGVFSPSVTREATTNEESMNDSNGVQELFMIDDDEVAGEVMDSIGSQNAGMFEVFTEKSHLNELALTVTAASASGKDELDPGINGKTTEAWVAQFFAQSRLHYIGSWQKRYERIKASCSIPARQETDVGRLWTLHVDMDCFFVSVSLKFRPDLVGQPVVVSHGRKTGATGEISCASYEARQFGVRAGMFMERALALCPNLHVIPYEFQLYDEASEQMYRVLLGITSSVEAVSCDEAFVFLRTSDPHAIIRRIRQEILQASGCVCSIGCSDAGKLLARIATRSAKPNGFCVVDSTVIPIQDFLDPLPVGDLPGVGSSTVQKLQRAGLALCQNVRLASVETVKTLLGQALGVKLHRICCGLNTSRADFDAINCSESSRTDIKKDSIGVQMSWGVRLTSIPHVHIFFRCLASELCLRASKANVRGRLLTLKLWIKSDGAPEARKHMGHGICYQISKSGALPQMQKEVNITDIMPVVISCFEKCAAGNRTLSAEVIRGVGITMSRLHVIKGASKEPSTCTQKQLLEELMPSDHQSIVAFGVLPASNISKMSDSASELSLSKRLRQPASLDASLSIQAPAEKRQWREPPISSSQLNQDVLAALPSDLRRQVQDEAQKVSALKRRNQEFNKRSMFDAQLQRHDLECQETTCARPQAVYIRIFAEESKTGNASLEEVLQMKRSIADWMAISPPTSNDVKLVGGIIRSLVTVRNMDSLRSFLLALARCATNVEPEESQNLWIEWVGRAIEFAQKKIFAVYSAHLCLL